MRQPCWEQLHWRHTLLQSAEQDLLLGHWGTAELPAAIRAVQAGSLVMASSVGGSISRLRGQSCTDFFFLFLFFLAV